MRGAGTSLGFPPTILSRFSHGRDRECCGRFSTANVRVLAAIAALRTNVRNVPSSESEKVDALLMQESEHAWGSRGVRSGTSVKGKL